MMPHFGRNELNHHRHMIAHLSVNVRHITIDPSFLPSRICCLSSDPLRPSLGKINVSHLCLRRCGFVARPWFCDIALRLFSSLPGHMTSYVVPPSAVGLSSTENASYRMHCGCRANLEFRVCNRPFRQYNIQNKRSGNGQGVVCGTEYLGYTPGLYRPGRHSALGVESAFLGDVNSVNCSYVMYFSHPAQACSIYCSQNRQERDKIAADHEDVTYYPQQAELQDASGQVLFDSETISKPSESRQFARGAPVRDPHPHRSSFSFSEADPGDSLSQAFDTDGVTWRRQNAALVKCAKDHGIDAAIDMLWEANHQGRAVAQNFNQVTSLLASNGRFKDGLDLAKEAARRNFANVITFRPLMKYCCSIGNSSLARRVWNATIECGVKPDMFLYAEYMGALVRCQNLSEAEEVLQSIIASGRRPHVVLYNTLLKGIAKRADVTHAFNLLNGMVHHHVEPDETTFNTVLNACVRAKDLDAVNQVMLRMREHGVKPGVPTFNTLLKLYAKAGKFEDALAIYHEMQQTVKPSIVTYNTLIDGCAHRGDMETAAEIFNEMLSHGMEPDICTMTSLLKGFGRANDPRRAVELYEAMKEGGYKIEERTRYAVINACLRGDDRVNARDLMSEMIKNNFTVRTRTWIWRLQRDIANDDEDGAMTTLREMEANSSFPDVMSKASILKQAREQGGFLRFQREWKAIRTGSSSSGEYQLDD